MRSEGERKEGHAALLKLHRGAHLSRASQTGKHVRIAHSHRGPTPLGPTPRHRASCTSTDVMLPYESKEHEALKEKKMLEEEAEDDVTDIASERMNSSNGNSPRKESVGSRRPTGFGYKKDVQRLSIPADDIDLESADRDDADQEGAKTPQLTEERQAYNKMCQIQGITPCGRFQRQMDDTVADVSNSQLGTKDIKSICVSLTSNVSIKDLDLSGNDLSGKGASYVAEALRENTAVQDLTLSECNIDLDGLKAITDVLLEMKPMKRIDLSKNPFGRSQAEILSEVIKRNDYIEDVVLSANQFDSVAAVSLGKALTSNIGIKRLDLSWNHIRREGATSICSALRYNQTLEELDLSWNGLAEEGCRALGTALPFNHTLRELDLTCNRISPFALKYLLTGLEKNDSLKTLRICQNPLTTEGAIALMKCLTKSEVSSITDIHMIDIPINPEFLDALDELLKVRKVKVFHRDPNKKKITPIIRQRTLKDYDPAMILFEYMKQENLRLIDLFRTFDTDSSQSVSKEELKEGFVTINMPLTDEALDSLFERLDINDNDEIEYDEYKIGYRKAMRRMREGLSSEDTNERDSIGRLKGLVHKALEDRRADKLLELKGKRRQRQASLTAVFRVGSQNDLLKKLEKITQGKAS